VGASTAVFTALGLLSAFSWRARYSLAQRWALRWGPLIAGVVLLGWTGVGGQDPSGEGGGGQNVDIVAHALGFASGILLGMCAALQGVARVLDRIPQWLTGVGALIAIAVAWGYALAS
jgi:rhomboid protease GluP